MSELPKLRGAGSVSAAGTERVAHERYAEFDAKRKEAERQVVADLDDLEELKRFADAAEADRSEGRDNHLANAVAPNPRSPYESGV